MGFCSDVKSTRLDASGDVFAGRGRVKAIYVQPGTAAGSVTIKDGGTSGTSVIVLDTIANGQAVFLQLPEDGVLCQTSVYCTLAGTATKATVFYA
ncbi:MAG: hypothetical protein EBT15_11590 [Betaproteobacteria bacterium]|nr:hypothetical protein [Betaproteobacteria bacterium]